MAACGVTVFRLETANHPEIPPSCVIDSEEGRPN